MNTPSPSTNSISMKPPNASSVPSLTDIDPFAPFEFHFPSQDMWWDFSDFSSSEPEDYILDSDLDVSFNSSFYHFLHDPDDEYEEDNMNDEENDMMKDEENSVKKDEDDAEDDDRGNSVIDVSDDVKNEDILVTKLISTISKIAPKLVYNRRKHSMKRKRNRRRRKRISAENVEPELRSLWHNCSSVGDLFAPSAVSVKPPPSNLPTINLNNINRTMLRRLPEVVEVPILACDENPDFYNKTIGNAVTRTTSIPFTKFDRPGGCCHGKLPAILTDLGPVPPPKDSQYGYVYVDGGWKVKAESPRVPDARGRHGRGDDGGGQVGGAERRGGWKRRDLCER